MLSFLDEFIADLSAEGLKVPRGDLQFGVDQQDLGGFVERASRGGGADRFSKNSGTILTIVQSLGESLGGKRLAGSASNSAWILEVRWVRLG